MNNLETGKETNLDKNIHQLLNKAWELQHESNKGFVSGVKLLPNSNTSLSNCHRNSHCRILLQHSKEHSKTKIPLEYVLVNHCIVEDYRNISISHLFT